VKEIIPSYVDTRFADFPATGNLKYRPITGWFARTVPEVWNYVFTSGDTIGATPNHPFFSEDRQAYIAIGDLRIGERVKLEGEVAATLHTKWKRENGQETVYNLEVWRDHNFHVGKSGLLVHNSCDVKDRFALFGSIDNIENLPLHKTIDGIPDVYVPYGDLKWTTKARKTDKIDKPADYREVRISEIIGEKENSKVHLAPNSEAGFDAIRESDGKILSFKGMNGANEVKEINNLNGNLVDAFSSYKEVHSTLSEPLKKTTKCEVWVSGEHASGEAIIAQWELLNGNNFDLDNYSMIDAVFYISPDNAIYQLFPAPN
jgi:hypothetical protein